MSILSIGPLFRTMRYLQMHQVLSRLFYRSRLFYYQSPFYGLFENSEENVTLSLTPPVLWKGDKDKGAAYLSGSFSFVGESVSMPNEPDWFPKGVSLLWIYNLHYFEWLNDLKTQGDEGSARARYLILDWIRECGHFEKRSWHPYPLSLRLISWINHAPWLLKKADETFKERFLESLIYQVHHLEKNLEWDVGGNHLLKNIKALIYSHLTVAECAEGLDESVRLLIDQLSIQILKDGAHFELSPHYHVDVLKDLLDIHALFRKAGKKPPSKLTHGIDKMAEALSFYIYPDGCLGLFNDSALGDKKDLEAVLKRAGGVEKRPKRLSSAGYVRLEMGKWMMMVDVGKCCPDNLPAHAHADTLSFELCLGGERIFVNSGTYAYQTPLRNILRGTAAHNTVVVEKTDSAEVWKSFRLGRRPSVVKHTLKSDAEKGVSLYAEHDGYRYLGLIHKRKITMTADGLAVEGEDRLEHPQKKPYATAHFHLHPSCTYSFKRPDYVEITTASGTRMAFTVDGATLQDGQGFYAPNFGVMHEGKQLIIRGRWQNKKCLMKWRIEML